MKKAKTLTEAKVLFAAFHISRVKVELTQKCRKKIPIAVQRVFWWGGGFAIHSDSYRSITKDKSCGVNSAASLVSPTVNCKYPC